MANAVNEVRGFNTGIPRALQVLRALAHASIATTLQYRLEALGEGLLALLWIATALVPVWVVFGNRPAVEGWTYPGMLLVIAWFTLLKSFLEGTINPSLLAVINHVRQGTLDFVLLKPADAQLLISFSKVEPARLVDFVTALVLFGYSFHKLHLVPTPLHVLTALILMLAALAVLYSIAILVISIAFVVIRADNLIFLFGSIFDLARWPTTIFSGALAFIFTYVVPLAFMTTYPAQALMGTLSLRSGGLSMVLAGVFAVAARLMWRASLRKYTSASS